jgi:hypothetical protein
VVLKYFMSSIVSSTIFTKTSASSALVSAFASVAATSAIDDLITAFTWNGDVTFGSMGDGPSASILSLDNKMVREVASFKHALKAGEHRAFTSVVMSDAQRAILDERFNEFNTRVSTLPFAEQKRWWSIMFNYLFYLRNLRGEGKREKILFYYLFDKMHQHYPKTAEALVSLIPDFGYFGDLDELIIRYRVSSPNVVKVAVQCYADHLDADALQVFGKKISEISVAEATELNTKLKAMTMDEMIAFRKGKKLSLASKWFPREGKKDSDHIDLFLTHFFWSKGGLDTIKPSEPALYKKRFVYSMMRLRKIITVLTQCIGVGEQLMTTSGKESDIHRNWADLDMEHAPSGFVTKYRKALLNESLTDPVVASSIDIGNRSTRDDRIECRKHTMSAILNGKLKGANTDLASLAMIIYGYASSNLIGLSSAERSLISQQWRDMVKTITDLVLDAIKLHSEDPEFLDPREAIFIVDTSGSMSSANVLHIAIALGLLGSSISSMTGCMISFSTVPTVYHIDQSMDVFDQFLTVLRSPMGYTTDIDKTYDCVLDLMSKSETSRSSFAIVYLTDGQFDSGLVVMPSGKQSRGPIPLTKAHFEDVFLGRMEAKFKTKGFTLPRTVFWNLNGMGSGYSATADIKGIQMVSGFSQTLMHQVLSGEYKEIVDPVSGSTRVDIDPWTSFVKAVTSETFAPVLRCVLETKEGVFGM